MSAGMLLRRMRGRHDLSQRRLAMRAGTGQSAISRIERDLVSPSVETLAHLMAAMGEELVVDSGPRRREYDPIHLQALRQRPPAERLQLAISWNRLASRLRLAGRAAADG